MSIHDNKAIARRLFEGLATEKVALIDELFSPDIVIHMGTNASERSLEEIKRDSRGMVDIVPDLRFTIEDMLAEGDKVSVRYSFEGMIQPTGQMQIPEADRRLSGTGMTILRITDGKITESWNESGTTRRISTYGPRWPRSASDSG